MVFWRARFVLGVPLLLTVLGALPARSEAAAARRRAVTIQDLQGIRNGFDGQLSADGRFVVFAVMEPARRAVVGNGPVSNLWIVSAAGSGAPVRLTASGHMDWLPRWAPDSKRIAYLSSGQDPARVYVTSKAQKNPVPVTPRDLDVSDFAWSPDGRTIAFVTSEDADPKDYVNRPFPNADEQVLSRKVVVSRLLAVDVSTRRVRQVTDEPLSILGFAWSPDGQSIALQVPKSAMLQSFRFLQPIRSSSVSSPARAAESRMSLKYQGPSVSCAGHRMARRSRFPCTKVKLSARFRTRLRWSP